MLFTITGQIAEQLVLIFVFLFLNEIVPPNSPEQELLVIYRSFSKYFDGVFFKLSRELLLADTIASMTSMFWAKELWVRKKNIKRE